MSGADRICVFYSPGEHFQRVVRNVRGQYPSARICAMVPAGFPKVEEGSEMDRLVDEWIVTTRKRYRVFNIGALRSLVAQIQGGRFDRFIVLFETLKLRGLAALSGAPVCECWMAYGRVKSIDTSLGDTLAGHANRAARGRWLFLRLWFLVHFTWVRGKPHTKQ